MNNNNNYYLIVFFFVNDIYYIFRAYDQAITDKFRNNINIRFKIRDLGKLR
jgi:hypothetical protein